MMEYGAVVLLIALLVGAVFGFGVPGKVAAMFEAGFDGIDSATGGNGESPGGDQTSGGEPEYWSQPNPNAGPGDGESSPEPESTYATDPNDPDYAGPPPGHPAGPPAEEYMGPEPEDADPEVVEATLADLEECLDRWNEDAPWFTGSCAWDTYKDLSFEDLAGVIDELSPQEIQRLFESGPIPLEQEYFDFVQEVMELSHLDTIRALQESGATPFAQPDFESVTGDPASGSSPGSVTYEELDDYSLYGDGDEPVKWEHIQQNALGDCWLMATMGAMAVQDPQLVEEMIEENPNGSFTVTFPGRDPITVTPDLPVNPDGTPAFAGSDEDPPVVWPAIIEKAYAQMEGNDYGSIENWHPGGAMNTFSGGAGTDYIPDFTGTDIDTLSDSFDDGEAITFSTHPGGDDKEEKELIQDDTLVSGHVYFVTSVDRDAGTVTVRNPWGTSTSDIVMTIDEVNDNIAAVHSTDLDD